MTVLFILRALKKAISINFLVGILVFQSPVWSVGMPQGMRTLCKEAIAKHEKQKGIPQGLLRAIAAVESGISPWIVNAKGRSHRFKSKAAAAAFVRTLTTTGFKNFSVGCMQLHYASHRHHFVSVEAMFEPENNIAHAAKLFKKLTHRYGSVDAAIRFYHSSSVFYQNRYHRQVYQMWAKTHESPAFLKKAALQKAS